ncbi:MAG: hypothetical protein WAN36_12275, partial [Calditrichia bacterium]
NPGSGIFISSGDSLITRTTPSDGIISALYRTSYSTAVGSDIIEISSPGAAALQYTIDLQPDSVASYSLSDSAGIYQYAAGDTFTLQIQAFDAHNNPVTNTNRPVTLQNAPGLLIHSSNPVQLTGGTARFHVSDTLQQNGLILRVIDNFNLSGNSAPFNITAGNLAHLQMRTEAGNLGQAASDSSFNLQTGQTLTLFAAGYDRFGNYVGDISAAHWSDDGELSLNKTGARLQYTPVNYGISGRILLEYPPDPSVAPDSSGMVTVISGAIDRVKIVLDSLGQNELNDLVLTAGQDIRLYAAGYDQFGNYIRPVPADWQVVPDSLGIFDNAAADSSVQFTADKFGDGTIRITYGGLTDVSGLISVRKGSARYVVIRTEANGGGRPYHFPDTLLTGETRTLYAAHYDTMGNYIGDQLTNWDTLNVSGAGIGGVPAGPATRITISPQLPGQGFITAQSAAPAVRPDTTGLIRVLSGEVDHIVIQDSPGSAGNEVITDTLAAGDSLQLYAAAYDRFDNYLGTVSADWSFLGDHIGFFSDSSNIDAVTFYARSAGTAVITAIDPADNLQDQTASIRVVPGIVDTLKRISETNNQIGIVGQYLPLPVRVNVVDAFGNPVPGAPIRWLPLDGGVVEDTLVFSNSVGIAETRWRLHDTTSVDLLAAYVKGQAGVDTVYFQAFPNPSSQLTMAAVSATTLPPQPILSTVGPIRVRIRDSNNNNVQGAAVSFAVSQHPAGSLHELTTQIDTTDAQGIAETYLILGNKLGTYKVTAFANATPSTILFSASANQPGPADTLVILSQKNPVDTVGQTLADSVRVKLMDEHGNPIAGRTLFFDVFGGSVNPATAVTSTDGRAAASWTLDTSVGKDSLRVRLQDFSVVSDTLVATTVHDAPSIVDLVSVRDVTHDSLSAIPGSAIPFIVKVTDQFGNPIPNILVNSEIVQGPNAVLATTSGHTTTEGLIINTIQIDDNLDETIFRTYISGVDTAMGHLFRLRYIPGSLSPLAAPRGEPLAFSLQIFNPGPYPVVLDTTGLESRLRFSDGINNYRAGLLTPQISASGAQTLQFETTLLDSEFLIANFTPEVVLSGAGNDQLLRGTLTTAPDIFSIEEVDLVSVVAAVNRIVRGDSVLIEMTLNNKGRQYVL